MEIIRRIQLANKTLMYIFPATGVGRCTFHARYMPKTSGDPRADRSTERTQGAKSNPYCFSHSHKSLPRPFASLAQHVHIHTLATLRRSLFPLLRKFRPRCALAAAVNSLLSPQECSARLSSSTFGVFFALPI